MQRVHSQETDVELRFTINDTGEVPMELLALFDPPELLEYYRGKLNAYKTYFERLGVAQPPAPALFVQLVNMEVRVLSAFEENLSLLVEYVQAHPQTHMHSHAHTHAHEHTHAHAHAQQHSHACHCAASHDKTSAK